MLTLRQLVIGVAGTLVLAGCTTSSGGGSTMENTVYSTHRIVQNLDQNIGTTVDQLSKTSADLAARVEATDRETRRLASMVEENQVRLQGVQQQLTELTNTLYRQMNLTPPRASSATPMTPIPEDNMARVPMMAEESEAESIGVRVRPPAPSPNAPDVTIEPPVVETPVVADTSAEADEVYTRARQLYTNEEFGLALDQFSAYLDRYPDTGNAANAQYWKAHSYFKLEEFDDAVREFQRLVDRYPTSEKVPIALHNQGVAYSRLGQTDAARETFERLVQQYPNDVVAEMARDKLQQLQNI